MSIFVSDPMTATLPPGFGKLSNAVRAGQPISVFGFSRTTDMSEVNRFAARFRAARAFREVVLDDYGDETQNGYSGLVSVLLTWSAFERFLKIFGAQQPTYKTPLRPSSAALLANIRAIPSAIKLYSLIALKAEGQTKTQIALFNDGKEANVTYLASSIRHTFAHGHLTPHAKGSEPGEVAEICELVREFHLAVMAQEFSARIDAAIGDRLIAN